MFEKATRLKLRFNTVRGIVSVEDLWDLPLTGNVSLDEIAVRLHNELRESVGQVSFVSPSSSDNSLLQLKFDVAKYILDVRVKERDARKVEADRASQKQKLLGILARKQDAELEGKTTEELSVMVQNL